jgi:4-amino-4-deoxy-L-arabinose transferase-like glycosyltransferase
MGTGERAPRQGWDSRIFPGTLWRVAIVAGILLRVAVVAIPGNHLYSPWSGRGDAAQYVLLAKNLAAGHGFTYALMPTAFRPPFLPVLAAGLMLLFGASWLIALRWIQFLLGLGTVYLIYRFTRRFFDEKAAKAALLISLFFPTLIYTTSEVLTECLSAFFVAAFLFYLARQMYEPDRKNSAGLGATTSLAALARFNLTALILPAAWATVARRDRPGWFARLVVVGAVSLAVVSPWIIRNWMVFGDHLILGTTSGYAALQGVLSPSGRAQAPETEQRKLSGWLNYDLETNGASRRKLPGEVELDHRDWQITVRLWKQKGWGMAAIMGEKLGYFWLSTDQLLHTGHFSLLPKLLRTGGVLVYWLALGLAIAGWLALRGRSPAAAWLLLFYVILMTVLNLPFAMETRHRVPMIDPLIAALAGGGWLQARAWWTSHLRRAPE